MSLVDLAGGPLHERDGGEVAGVGGEQCDEDEDDPQQFSEPRRDGSDVEFPGRGRFGGDCFGRCGRLIVFGHRNGILGEHESPGANSRTCVGLLRRATVVRDRRVSGRESSRMLDDSRETSRSLRIGREDQRRGGRSMREW